MTQPGSADPRLLPDADPPRIRTERVALHTRLEAGMEEEYDRVHATIPTDLKAALRRGGVRRYSIWRDGQDLFHLIEADDFAAMRATVQGDPADAAWQSRIDALLETPEPSADRLPLRLVWELD